MKKVCCYSAVALTVLLSGCIVAPPRQQMAAPQQVAVPPQAQPGPPLGIEDVKALAKAGLSDDVIISQIRSSAAVFHLSAADIILLKNAGVSERVINFMINTPSTAVPPPATEAPPPVAVAPPPVTIAPPPAVVVEPVMIPESYVWDGYEYVGLVGNQYLYLGPDNFWLVLDPIRLERFHGWERVHPEWRMHAIRNERFRSDRNGHVHPSHEARKDDREAH